MICKLEQCEHIHKKKKKIRRKEIKIRKRRLLSKIERSIHFLENRTRQNLFIFFFKFEIKWIKSYALSYVKRWYKTRGRLYSEINETRFCYWDLAQRARSIFYEQHVESDHQRCQLWHRKREGEGERKQLLHMTAVWVFRFTKFGACNTCGKRNFTWISDLSWLVTRCASHRTLPTTLWKKNSVWVRMSDLVRGCVGFNWCLYYRLFQKDTILHDMDRIRQR